MAGSMGREKLPSSLFDLISSSLDFIFPPVCLGCEGIGAHWCEKCEAELQVLTQPYCQICCKVIEVESEVICEECQTENPAFYSARALARYTSSFARAIVHLKYQPNKVFAASFVPRLAAIVNKEAWDIDVIVPIPLSHERFIERGYNQVEMFSKPLARMLGLPHGGKFLSRAKNTRPQVGLSHTERKKNVKDAFLGEKHLVSGKKLLLVDDVMTTGSSFHSAALALKAVGALEVRGLSLARADQHVLEDI